MAANLEPYSEVTAETKIDKNDGGGGHLFYKRCEIEENVLPVGKLPPETTVERWVADIGCSRNL